MIVDKDVLNLMELNAEVPCGEVPLNLRQKQDKTVLSRHSFNYSMVFTKNVVCDCLILMIIIIIIREKYVLGRSFGNKWVLGFQDSLINVEKY